MPTTALVSILHLCLSLAPDPRSRAIEAGTERTLATAVELDGNLLVHVLCQVQDVLLLGLLALRAPVAALVAAAAAASSAVVVGVAAAATSSSVRPSVSSVGHRTVVAGCVSRGRESLVGRSQKGCYRVL